MSEHERDGPRQEEVEIEGKGLRGKGERGREGAGEGEREMGAQGKVAKEVRLRKGSL